MLLLEPQTRGAEVEDTVDVAVTVAAAAAAAAVISGGIESIRGPVIVRV